MAESNVSNLPDRRSHRVNVNFSADAYETLETLARLRGRTMSEVLRDAIALEWWFHQERSHGNKILLERPNGSVREVIPR